MKPVALALLTCLAPLAAVAATASDLALKQGDIFTDAVGSVIGVAVTNNSNATIGSAVVTCSFTAKGKALGSASTTIYNIVPGAKGQDQVHLISATADAANCSITSTTAPTDTTN